MPRLSFFVQFLVQHAPALLLTALLFAPVSGQQPIVEGVGSRHDHDRFRHSREEEYHFDLSPRELTAIDRLAVKLESSSHEIVQEVREHFAGQRHTEKLAADATGLHQLAERLHEELHRSESGYSDFRRLRSDATQFIEIVARLPRTIGLIEQQPLDPHGNQGLRHMRQAYREAHTTAMAIDAYLPVDTKVVDRQAKVLLEAVKESHAEFHEHLHHYELSHQIDIKLQRLEKIAKHVHEIAHHLDEHGIWQQEEIRHLGRDAADLREVARETERLIVSQARRGIRQEDFIGVEHSQDAMTDIHAAAYLLEHMISKWEATHPRVSGSMLPPLNDLRRTGPRRDRAP